MFGLGFYAVGFRFLGYRVYVLGFKFLGCMV